MKTIPEMSAEVQEYLKIAGWLDTPVSLPEAMMMLVTEAVETVEAWRKWDVADATTYPYPTFSTPDDFIPKPEGVGSEFADIFIRLLDSAERFGVDLEAEYERKMAYNRTRPYRHGDKKI